jgi:hypothetical protein
MMADTEAFLCWCNGKESSCEGLVEKFKTHDIYWYDCVSSVCSTFSIDTSSPVSFS